MDYFLKKLKPTKLTVDWNLEQKHSNYKTCVAEKVFTYMSSGKFENQEFCTEEKKAYYEELHKLKKIEHDNLLNYYKENVVGKPYII